MTCRAFISANAASLPPSTSKVTTVPPPSIWRLASSCCGWTQERVARPGETSRVRLERRGPRSRRGRPSARTRSDSVSRPLSSTQALNGDMRRPGVPHEVLHRPVDELLGAEHRAAERAALAVDVLGRRVDDDVGAELERLGEHRRAEDVVDDDLRAGRVRQLGDGRDVDELLHRVARRLEEDRGRRHGQRLAPLVEVGAVDEDGLDAPARQDLVEDDEARAEQAPATTRRGRPAAAAPPARRRRPPCRTPVAKHASAPSSRRSRSSNIATVGLP